MIVIDLSVYMSQHDLEVWSNSEDGRRTLAAHNPSWLEKDLRTGSNPDTTIDFRFITPVRAIIFGQDTPELTLICNAQLVGVYTPDQPLILVAPVEDMGDVGGLVTLLHSQSPNQPVDAQNQWFAFFIIRQLHGEPQDATVALINYGDNPDDLYSSYWTPQHGETPIRDILRELL